MLHSFFVLHLWLKGSRAQVVPSIRNISSSCHLSRARSFDPHSTPSLMFSTLPSSDTQPKEKEPSCTRHRDMLRRFLNQKGKDRNFDVRRWRNCSRGRSQMRRRWQMLQSREKQYDCSQWLSEGRSKRDSCIFKYDENIREKGKGRNPIRSRSQDSNRSSKKGDGEADGKGPKSHQFVLQKRCATSSRSENARVVLCDYWHPLECPKKKSNEGCRFGDMCSFGHLRRQWQGKKRTKDSKPDKATTAVVKDIEKLGCVSSRTELPHESMDVSSDETHFHDTSTDTQHQSAHTFEESLGSTTPLMKHPATARSTFGLLAELRPSTHCTTKYLRQWSEPAWFERLAS